MVTKLDEKRPLARVILADPDALARRAIRDGFDEPHDFVVIAEAGDGVEAAELAAHYRPEFVLLETVLPRIDGLTAMERILDDAPGTHVVMLTAARGADIGLAALRGGASGFLGKDVGVEGVVEGMRAVLRGEIATSPEMTRRLVEHLRCTPEFGIGMRPVKSALSSREWEVLDLLTVGRSTADIAGELYLTVETVKSHVKHVLRKLDAHSRAEAVESARRLRWQVDERTLRAA
ncbi:MAG: LuxR C-terminal-related transcriptional regulator [Solirubrobacteraceae bacterium]